MPSRNHQIVRKPLSRPPETEPKFSFVVPVRNGEKTLLATLSSLIEQKNSSFEIIAVDNASTAGTRRLIRAFPGIRYASCTQRGRSQARNLGARLARGDYLAFVDADVVLAPDWLTQVERYLEKVPLDALVTQIAPSGNHDSSLDHYRTHFASWKSKGTFLSVRSRAGAYPLINTAACVVKRASFERVGGFDENLERHEDLDLSFRLFARGFLIGGTSAAKAQVRFTSEESHPLAREIAYLRRAFEVQSMSLFPAHRKPVNFALLREIGIKCRDPKALTVALLVEAAWQLGGIHTRLTSSTTRSYQLAPGRNLLCTTFRYKNKNYFLKPGLNLIFVDSAVYLCAGPWRSRRLSKKAAESISRLCVGNLLEERELVPLLRLGAFHPSLPVTQRTGEARKEGSKLQDLDRIVHEGRSGRRA